MNPHLKLTQYCFSLTVTNRRTYVEYQGVIVTELNSCHEPGWSVILLHILIHIFKG